MKKNIILLLITMIVLVTGCSLFMNDSAEETPEAVDIAAIPGVAAPVLGETPVTAITETDQYTGTVSWSPDDTPFAEEKVYTATITLTAKSGYTFTGVTENFFTVAGADTVTHDADTGVVTAVFPATAPPEAVDIAAIPGVAAPVLGETPVTAITETDQYTGTVSWSPDDTPFAEEKVYTATITLTAKSGYTFTGVTENFFTVAGADTVTHDADSGVVTAVFPETEAVYAIGDTGPSGVGIVFYVTDGGLHGLEVAPDDQSAGTQWSNVQNEEVMTTGTAIGTGSANTDAIIGQTCHSESAAKICRDYREEEEGDWYLPSKDELQEIWWNLVSDQSADNSERGKPYGGSLGGFAKQAYWSSSEYSSNDVWYQHFNTGYQHFIGKAAEIVYVRAVRSF